MNELVETLNFICTEIRELKNVLQDIRGGIDDIKEEDFQSVFISSIEDVVFKSLGVE